MLVYGRQSCALLPNVIAGNQWVRAGKGEEERRDVGRSDLPPLCLLMAARRADTEREQDAKHRLNAKIMH